MKSIIRDWLHKTVGTKKQQPQQQQQQQLHHQQQQSHPGNHKQLPPVPLQSSNIANASSESNSSGSSGVEANSLYTLPLSLISAPLQSSLLTSDSDSTPPNYPDHYLEYPVNHHFDTKDSTPSSRVQLQSGYYGLRDSDCEIESMMAASEKDAYPSDTSADINLSLPTSDAEEHIPYYEGLEDYKLIRKMGEGAFSIVYWAVNIRTNEEVAVKVVRKKDLTPIQRANILKELRIHSALSHPHIVRLLGHKETPEYYFLFLEGCRGGEVFNKIVDLTCFSEDLSRWVITQVGEAVRYLHEEVGVVHRDIKPENLLFLPIPMNEKTSSFRTSSDSKEGTFIPNVGGGGIGVVKLCDFGLSKVIWDEMTKTPCGTVGYTAPEIVLHPPGGHSKSVDMWAIGCVLYTMLCGFPPFYDDDPNVLTEKVAKGHWEFLTPWWDPISAGAKDLVKHLLTVNPSERYTIDEFFQHPWVQNRPFIPGRTPHPRSKSVRSKFIPPAPRSKRLFAVPSKIAPSQPQPQRKPEDPWSQFAIPSLKTPIDSNSHGGWLDNTRYQHQYPNHQESSHMDVDKENEDDGDIETASLESDSDLQLSDVELGSYPQSSQSHSQSQSHPHPFRTPGAYLTPTHQQMKQYFDTSFAVFNKLYDQQQSYTPYSQIPPVPPVPRLNNGMEPTPLASLPSGLATAPAQFPGQGQGNRVGLGIQGVTQVQPPSVPPPTHRLPQTNVASSSYSSPLATNQPLQSASPLSGSVSPTVNTYYAAQKQKPHQVSASTGVTLSGDSSSPEFSLDMNSATLLAKRRRSSKKSFE